MLQRQAWTGEEAREAKEVRALEPITSLLTSSTVAEALAGQEVGMGRSGGSQRFGPGDRDA